MKIAVIGAGWAGLAAAVRATQAGHAVTIYELAPMPGGRARSDSERPDARDNGQHILLGAYERCWALMRDVGIDLDTALQRSPLHLRYPNGRGFALARGPRLIAAARALLNARGFSTIDKLSALWMAAHWYRRGFRCPESLTVAQLLRGTVSARVRAFVLEPLCVAALNTPAAQASASVWLSVMRDSLFGAPGAADLLVPRRPLAQLLPLPAMAWLSAHGARFHLRHRVRALTPMPAQTGRHWRLELSETGPSIAPGATDQSYDCVIVATPATEAARLVGPIAPAWAQLTIGLEHEPIVTLLLRTRARPWASPMLALEADEMTRPAQFAFKLERQEGDKMESVSLVISAASAWLARGNAALIEAALAQFRAAFAIPIDEPVECLDIRADRRATFRCVAGVKRPPTRITAGLLAAGDYVASPYPATLEAAVRAGEAAALACQACEY